MSKIGGQHPDEWNAFIEFLQDKNIESYLEVGAREGIALRYLVERLPIKKVVAVDLPGGPWGRGRSDVKLINNLEALDAVTGMVLGDSADPDVIDAATGKYDLVFIDADHSYEGAKFDYKTYGPMGRIVALHDINQDVMASAYGPTQLWNEIKGNKVEFIAPGSRKGIGVILGNN